MKKRDIDQQLKITTKGIDDSKEDFHHNRYEPTTYEVLDRLIESGLIQKENILVDVGCGKGRVALYLNHVLGCKAIGIDFNQELIDIALENKEKMKSDVDFFCQSAQEYIITNEDCFYFFNPFSLEILRSVISNILTSYYQTPRKITCFFYYPEDEFLSYMMGLDEFICVDEIDCNEDFCHDEREKIIIFEIYNQKN